MPIDATSKRRERGLACAGVLAATVLATSAVQAQVTQPADPGVMSFPNVRIVSKPEAARAAAPSDSSAGFRAFIDVETGRLTSEPSSRQLRDLEHGGHAALRQAPASRAAPLRGTTISGISLELDDSFLLYSVVRRSGSGEIEEACVQGEDLARSFLAGNGSPMRHAEEGKATK